MICRVCFLSNATTMSLNFADGEVITLDLCEECAAKFEGEELISRVTTS